LACAKHAARLLQGASGGGKRGAVRSALRAGGPRRGAEGRKPALTRGNRDGCAWRVTS